VIFVRISFPVTRYSTETAKGGGYFDRGLRRMLDAQLAKNEKPVPVTE
jgi:hypothetical protein